MRDYELVLVIDPEGGDEAANAAAERVHAAIRERGGEVTHVDPWGKQRLAYPINRKTEAYYVVTRFRADPQSIRLLEAGLDLAEDILRHLIVRVEETAAAAAAAE